MTPEQLTIFAITLFTLALFLWGRWRHDMVALGALLLAVLSGLVPAHAAFAGFGHPAVITVACVLILSNALQATGAVEALTRRLLPSDAGRLGSLAALTGLAALLSGFINNVGALAILMPVAMRVAARQNLPAGQILMPLAFGSILGGMTTMIGTPPNLVVSGFRAETGARGFAMFDFTPVGLAVAVAGLLFIVLIGWRLVPYRRQTGDKNFETSAYVTEARVPEGASVIGQKLLEMEAALVKADAEVVGLIRNEVHLVAPHPWRLVQAGDILLLQAEPESLTSALSSLGLQMEGAVEEDPEELQGEETAALPKQFAAEDASSMEKDGREQDGPKEEVELMELVVLPDSPLQGRSATDILLRSRYGINLLAISRQGQQNIKRLRNMQFRTGDVLLMQGGQDALLEFAVNFGCVPLAERELHIPDRRKIMIASGIMVAAVSGAALGLLPAAISFAGAVLAALVTGVMSPRKVYEGVDWPVIVLLAALLPVAGAMESTGAADLIATFLLDFIAQGNAVIALVVILVATMTLSDLMNNAATAAVMCPIAIGIAAQLGANPDGFLMAVAVGASCAFLTPIGHQNNTLILGPGGFRFGDYWRLGLPLEIIVIAVSVPMLLWVWPL
ncbi:SLC13 family permease [Desulfurivibrio alkaliphilus]|uniref:Citrate transporter n=1 Tax=Desulfurivibrio alkaliphilus (strain DSM 19089 / UNIQEM U267 / AHT2) TaxID=589865 RepID=D6Z084_DESAT|nr:SLC13 family permease [Desulfurivibrio alkaliphilus]ADH87117.1 Citrate transporter [Desulfurivibrio alkaliphilus AHT 2]